MKKLFLFALLCIMVLSASAQYVDLGLPSGTKWKATNESGFYTIEEALNFGDNLPAKWQLEELRDHCSWQWTGNGYKVIGSNGKSIFIPAEGYLWGCNDYGVYESGVEGYLLSSARKGSGETYSLIFDAQKVSVAYRPDCQGQSVRLVQQ